MIPASAEKYVYHREPGIVLLHGDCLEILPELEHESIQCCVTSPPYWGLRDYGEAGQLGLELSPESYVERISEVFAGVSRALRPDGTLWLNLGDSYASGKGTCYNPGGGDNSLGKERKEAGAHPLNRGNKSTLAKSGLKPKDLVGIPWRVAFALQADGWYLRSDIIEEVELYCPCGCGHVLEERIIRYAQDRDLIWHKPNPMPESVTDRPTRAHEYIFLMSKSPSYYYDKEAIMEDSITDPLSAASMTFGSLNGKRNDMKKARSNKPGKKWEYNKKRNKRSVWKVVLKPFKGAHFAIFPPELIEPCILAGTKEGDIVLDPFSGSATVGQVCKKHKRKYIGIELNEDYLKLSPDRIGNQGVLL